jgi:hypothetical protein
MLQMSTMALRGQVDYFWFAPDNWPIIMLARNWLVRNLYFKDASTD